MMGYLGHKIARRILDRPNAPLCAFDEGRSADGRIGAFPVVPLYRGYPWFLPLFQSSYRLRDVIARISGT
jgi:hypothetical protein